MDLVCSICNNDLDICTRWPRLIPNTGDTICQCCVNLIVDGRIESSKILHLQHDLDQLSRIKQNPLRLDDFPLNQSLLRILQKHKSQKATPHNFESKLLNNQTIDHYEWTTEEPSVDLEELASSIKKQPQKINIKKLRYQTQSRLSPEQDDSSFSSLNYSAYSSGAVCSTHRRQLEVVCIQCQQMICTNCALFGVHRGHHIYSEEDMISVLEMKGAELLEMVERIHSDSLSMDKSVYDEDFKQQQQQGCGRLIESVQNEFAELRKRIEQKEKHIISQIQNIYDRQYTQWNEWWSKNSNMEKECHQWLQQAQGAFDMFTEPGHQYWELLSMTDSLKSKGQNIQLDIKKMMIQIQQKRDSILSEETTIKFYQNNIRLDEFYKLNELVNNNVLIHSFQQHSNEESDLLGDVSVAFIEQSPFSKTENIKSVRPFRSITPNQAEQTDYSLSPLTKGTTSLEKRDTNRLSTARKRSNVPLKMQLYIDELKKGKLDVAEFTGVDLSGENILCNLCQEIRQWKVRSLKLLRCKLLDEHVPLILKAMQGNENIQSINLSQNLLTDKIIDIFYQYYTSGLINQTMKNITVSQTKINARNVKHKVLEIKKLGLIITL